MGTPTYIGIGSQKGGVGKSTIAELLSSILHYEMSYNVLVMDCDTAQNSFFNLRLRDRDMIESGTELGQSLLNKFKSYNRDAYTILRTKEATAIDTAQEHLLKLQEEGKEEIDYVIFDMPGRCDTRESLALALSMDYILSPLEADIQSLVASMSYATTIESVRVKIPECRLKGLYMFWNKIDERVRMDVLRAYRDIMQKDNIQCLKSQLFYRKKFSRETGEAKDINELFRCTLMAPKDTQRLGTGLSEFLTELKHKGIIGKLNEGD